MPVTVICNASTTLGCCQSPWRWAGAGAAPQIGGKLAAEPRSGCTLDASAAAAGSPVTLQVTLYLPIRAASARPCVAADTRASGRTLRACCPLGAPLGGCSPSRRAAPCPRAAAPRCQKVPRLAGRAQRDPLATPLNACWRLAALPARATYGGGLSACARGCRWHSLRNNARASRADGAAALPPLHCPAAGALSRARRTSPAGQRAGARLAACRWPHLGGAWATRPCNGPGPVGPALII